MALHSNCLLCSCIDRIGGVCRHVLLKQSFMMVLKISCVASYDTSALRSFIIQEEACTLIFVLQVPAIEEM